MDNAEPVRSMGELARRLGLSKATVSLALRGTGTIAKATAERVRAEAARHGYRANPLVAAMARERMRGAAAASGIPLALLYYHEGAESAWRVTLRERITELAKPKGYAVRSVNLAKERGGGAALARRLYHAGCQGVLVWMMEKAPPELWEGWATEHFAWAALMSQPNAPAVDFVSSCPAEAVIRAWRECVARGYRRIGFALTRHAPTLPEDDLRVAGAMLMRHEWPRFPKLRIFDAPISLDTEPFLAWVAEARPEVVVGFNELLAQALARSGRRVPEDVAYVSVAGVGATQRLTGVRQGIEDRVELALQRLDYLIRHNRRGLPAEPLEIRPPLRWHEGGTLPVRCGGGAGRMNGECSGSAAAGVS